MKASGQVVQQARHACASKGVFYPNPVSSFLEVQMFSEGKIFLSDVSGKIVWSNTILNRKQIDMSSFAPGTYILTFLSNSSTYHLKVIKL
jgi:hypothetical protein